MKVPVSLICRYVLDSLTCIVLFNRLIMPSDREWNGLVLVLFIRKRLHTLVRRSLLSSMVVMYHTRAARVFYRSSNQDISCGLRERVFQAGICKLRKVITDYKQMYRFFQSIIEKCPAISVSSFSNRTEPCISSVDDASCRRDNFSGPHHLQQNRHNLNCSMNVLLPR